jgi:anti-sigma regulatory factor (Ser/Thr protein kinase)
VDSHHALRARSYSTRLPSARGQVDEGAHEAAAATLHLRLPATSPSESILRTELATWLRNLGSANGTTFDLQIACAEILTIMIGQPGHRSALVIDVEATSTDRTVAVTVREFGLCGTPGNPRTTLDQALSLTLIEAMTDTLDIDEHPQGRTFTLRRKI